MNCEYPYCSNPVFAVIVLQHIPSNHSEGDKYTCFHHLTDFIMYLLFRGTTKYLGTEINVIVHPIKDE